MARADLKLVTPLQAEFSYNWQVPSGTANSIKAGEPTKTVDAAAASPYLGTTAIMVDGDGSTSQRFTGLAKNTSSDTASAAGDVWLWMPLPGLIYTGKAKTSTNANTTALINALTGKRVVFDLTSSTWTIDSAAADAVANCVVIVGGDPNVSELKWMYRHSGSVLDFSISA